MSGALRRLKQYALWADSVQNKEEHKALWGNVKALWNVGSLPSLEELDAQMPSASRPQKRRRVNAES